MTTFPVFGAHADEPGPMVPTLAGNGQVKWIPHPRAGEREEIAMTDAAQLGDVQPGSDPTMVGVAFQTYQMLDGTKYVADASGVISVQSRHVSVLLTHGCQLKASGLPA
jgi:hypothetical protein